MYAFKWFCGLNLFFGVLLLLVAFIAVSRDMPSSPLDKYSKEESDILAHGIYELQDSEALQEIREMIILEDRLTRALKSGTDLLITVSVVCGIAFIVNSLWFLTSIRAKSDK